MKPVNPESYERIGAQLGMRPVNVETFHRLGGASGLVKAEWVINRVKTHARIMRQNVPNAELRKEAKRELIALQQNLERLGPVARQKLDYRLRELQQPAPALYPGHDISREEWDAMYANWREKTFGMEALIAICDADEADYRKVRTVQAWPGIVVRYDSDKELLHWAVEFAKDYNIPVESKRKSDFIALLVALLAECESELGSFDDIFEKARSLARYQLRQEPQKS
jgi:hypothetical protein